MEDFNWYAWVILPVIVFLARVVDVTIGTLRIIFTSRGRRGVAPLLGGIEVFVWIIATSQIMKQAHTLTAFLGYAAGFAVGNYVGMFIEDKLAMGTVVIRTILAKSAPAVIEALKTAGYGVTCVDGQGATGPVQLIYTVVKRKDVPEVTALIHTGAPRAFLTIEEVRSAEQGIFPAHASGRSAAFERKSK
ncbi:MAG: DUF2179 domain-containing protein [Chloroflexota bacterium]